jgi:5-methylcytosine-specific restriction endonuclease McrA
MKPNLFQKGQVPHNLGERHAAKIRGDKHYFTGKPCSRGHIALRSVRNGSCQVCAAENQANVRAKRTPEQIQAVNAYARQNVKKWVESHRGDPRIKETKRRWKKNNVAYTRADSVRRYAAKINRTPNWLNAGEFFEIECIYKYCAGLRKIGMNYHVDHIVPLQGDNVSGLHVPWNLQVIHADENLSKGNKHYG